MKRMHSVGGTPSSQPSQGSLAKSNLQAQLVIEPVNVRCQKKGLLDVILYPSAKITTTAGNIVIVSAGHSPLHIKTTEIVRQPRMPRSQDASWLLLDFVQNIDAKYANIDFQVHPEKMSELVDTLGHAWTAGADCDAFLFGDDADEIPSPVHKRASRHAAVPQRSVRRGPSTKPAGDEATSPPSKSQRLGSPTGEKQKSSEGGGEPATPKSNTTPSSSTPTNSIPWLSEKRVARESGKQPLAAAAAATATTTPMAPLPVSVAVPSATTKDKGQPTAKDTVAGDTVPAATSQRPRSVRRTVQVDADPAASSSQQVAATTTLSQRVLDPVNVKYQKKGHESPTTTGRARITVTPGVIEIASIENKFPTFHVKTSDIVKPPSLPKAGTATWLSLDCLQKIDAKYLWINLQAEPGKIGNLLDTLLHAWRSEDKNYCRRAALFNDQAASISTPVHTRPRNVRAALFTDDADPKTAVPVHAVTPFSSSMQQRGVVANEQLKAMDEKHSITKSSLPTGVGIDQSNQQVAPTTTHSQRVFEAERVLYISEDCQTCFGGSARITVTPGKIFIVDNNAKYSPIIIKIEDIVRPTRLNCRNMKLLVLDFVQSDVKCHIEVGTRIMMDELLDTLLHAWSVEPNDNASVAVSLAGEKNSGEGNQIQSGEKEATPKSNSTPLSSYTPAVPISWLSEKRAARESGTPQRSIIPMANQSKGSATDGDGSRPALANSKSTADSTPARGGDENYRPIGWLAAVFAKRRSAKEAIDDADGARRSRSPVPAKLMRLGSPAEENKDSSDGSQARSGGEEATPQNIVAPSAAAATGLSDGLQAVKEYNQILNEFGLMADDVYSLDKKERDELVREMKTWVGEAVKRKRGE